MWGRLASLVYFGMLQLPSDLFPVFSRLAWPRTSRGRLLGAPHRVSLHSTYRVFSEIICWLQISKCRSVNAPVEEEQRLSALRAREIYTGACDALLEAPPLAQAATVWKLHMFEPRCKNPPQICSQMQLQDWNLANPAGSELLVEER